MSARSSLAERAALSGQDLGLISVQFGKRKGAPPMMCLTDRDLRLMALLLDVNYLLTSQLVLLGWGSSSTRAAQKRLKVLHDAGFLDRFRPVRRIGSAEWIYRLSTRGWKALASQEMVDGARYKPAAFTSISYTAHDLQLSALILRIALAAGDSYTDGLIDTMPFTWQGPRSGRIAWQGPRGKRSDRDWRDDFDLHAEDERERDVNEELGRDGHKNVERSPAAQLPLGTRLYKCESRSGYLEPDATLIGGSGEDRFAVLIEYDRTDRPHKQIDRLRRYDWWLLEGWRETHFATHASPPMVIFLTSRERPLRRLVQTADQVLSAWYGLDDEGPREGTHPGRDQILFTSRDRIHAGDWTMDRTPSLPLELRREPDVCRPNSLVYDLPAALSRSSTPSDADQPGIGTDVACPASETP
jgi:Replication-relaxation